MWSRPSRRCAGTRRAERAEARGRRAHNKPSGEGNTTVWNVSGDLEISDYLYVRGQVGTSFRLPDAYELFVADPCCEQGNPDLKGEESLNAEAGFGGRSIDVSWELIVFHRELEDLIQIVTVTEARPVGTPGNFPCAEDPVNGCFDTFDNEGRRSRPSARSSSRHGR